MHVALIFSEERLLHEHVMLNRLVIGLLADGLRVTRIVPEAMSREHVLHGEQRIALAPRIETDFNVLPWIRKTRANRLALEMEKSIPDAIYAIGRPSWEIGLDLAHALDRPLLLNVWNARMARRVPTGRRARHVAAYVTPTHALRRLLGQSIDPGLVCTVPMGIAIPSQSVEAFSNPQQSASLAVIGGCRDIPAYRAMLGGISRIRNDLPQLRVFMELRGSQQHEIWRYVQKLKLLDCVSTLTDSSPHRQLLSKCDAMLIPERFGELYSIMLEGMANGMVILANQDPMLDMLIADETACLVDSESPDLWARQIKRMIQDPESARELGQRSKIYAREHHATGVQVEALIGLLERVEKGGAYSFEQAAGSTAG